MTGTISSDNIDTKTKPLELLRGGFAHAGEIGRRPGRQACHIEINSFHCGVLIYGTSRRGIQNYMGLGTPFGLTASE